ncbi:hypothetical protein TNCV_1647001 [Trichonephila clavipes]|nr:hypothetical protein TNCV_1647001 [Trichonephila clavipes]
MICRLAKDPLLKPLMLMVFTLNAEAEVVQLAMRGRKTKVEEKQFETLNKETATHIGIREAEDWFRPIDLAKECDIYISSKTDHVRKLLLFMYIPKTLLKIDHKNFKPKIKENYPQYLERENKKLLYIGDSSHYARDCEKRFKPKESNDHIHNRINVNTLKIESENKTAMNSQIFNT